MKLLIAIPALNEEDSIENIIRRTLAARAYICSHSPVSEVEITVVSDGSTDRTVERASRYGDQVNLIVFPENKGYGAAIKEAWSRSDADVLGFLDADGTCDPTFFANLCEQLVAQGADVVLGCRLNQQSQMPMIRRVGNSLFATLLTVFSSARVRDTASGMRVIRRSSLESLLPLPDGLHFTPAMSARAMLSDVVKIVEIDMSYYERSGESKLRVGRDGLRFLRVIIEAAFLYKPARPFGIAGLILSLAALMLMSSPTRFYATHRFLEEWMIYRFIVSSLAGTSAVLCFSASYLTGRMTQIALGEEISKGNAPWTTRLFRSAWFWSAPTALVLIGGVLVLASFLQMVATGHTTEHWSRFIVMGFCFSTAVILAITSAIDFVLDLVQQRVHYWKAQTSGPASKAQRERAFV